MVNKVNDEEKKEFNLWRAVLRARLANAGMTQKDFARKLGVSEAFISQVFHGNKWSQRVLDEAINLEPLAEVAEAFNGVS